LDFLPLCPAFWRTPPCEDFRRKSSTASWQPAATVGGPDSPEQTPEGIPFNVGMWIGPDGKGVIAALNPGRYGNRVHSDISEPPSSELTPEQLARLTPDQLREVERSAEPNWVERINLDGKVTGVYADYHYVGGRKQRRRSRRNNCQDSRSDHVVER
jgi:alpha-mannosidase